MKHIGWTVMGANSIVRFSISKKALVSALVIIGILISSSGFAQELLEKKITLRVSNESIDQVLRKIENLGGFSFSYSPDVIDVRARVSFQANNRTVREVLNEIFKGSTVYKERRKYIILQNIPPGKENELPENFDLNGYVIDKRTGERLANASIYESVTLASTISNQYGYYKIRLPTAQTILRLEVRKEDYVACSIPVTNRKDSYLPISLNPDTLKPLSTLALRLSQRPDSLFNKFEIRQYETVSQSSSTTDTSRIAAQALQQKRLRETYQKVQNGLVTAFASAKQIINTRNITDTLHRPFQASLLPFFGTNWNLSGNIVNDFSVNFIAGYSLGVNKLEVGAILNVIRGDVNGFQLAGISNIVGHDVTGFQYANALNITQGNFRGFQGSNLLNYAGKDFHGFQVAGVGNVIAGTLNGYQIAAIYNFASNVESGHQIGFVNYADYSKTIPIGLFSYVRRNGYRRYEFGMSELNYFNFEFKTGVTRLYNIFAIGFNGLKEDKPLATVGYGFGTAQNLGKGWAVNLDATINAILLRKQKIDEILAGQLRFSASIEKKLGQRFALFAGPSLNLISGKYSGLINADGKGLIKPIWLTTLPDGSTKHYGWIGFQAGIRFCNKI